MIVTIYHNKQLVAYTLILSCHCVTVLHTFSMLDLGYLANHLQAELTDYCY